MTTTTTPESGSKHPRKAARPAKTSANSKPAGAGDAPPPATAAPKQPTKAAQVEALLTHAEGASLDDLCRATSWLPHTCRAFLTGLRKKGRTLERSKREDGSTICRLVSAAAASASAATETAEAQS